MKIYLKKFSRLLPLILLLQYLSVSLFISYLHNHESDIHFHEFCPACQWEIQAKNIDSVTEAVWQTLLHPFICETCTVASQTDFIILQIFYEDKPSRAPPAIM